VKTFLEANVRAAWTAAIQAGGAFFTALQITDASTTEAGIAAGVAFFLAMGARGGIEGAWDARKKSRESLPEPIDDPSTIR